jgi:diaminohydroxyphosphoribosylaminopyrimidine deaminase/5-amino-6-(5-phosphoribosylamino)uracil reductase
MAGAGIRRVVVGLVDPDPRVSGKGIEYLRSRGIDVETGPFEEEIRDMNRIYLHHTAKGRSFLHLKMAGSLDGRSAAADGTSRWITGEESRRRVHEFRKDAHAVLIGGKTAAADDPLLSVRDIECAWEEQPARIIYTDFELPPGLKVFNTPGRTIVATGNNVSAPPSAELWTGIGSPEELLQKTAEEGLGLILCEGGRTLAASLIVNGLVDRLSIFTAPALIGENGVPLLGALNVKTIDGMLRLKNVEVTRTGNDILTEGQIVHRAD